MTECILSIPSASSRRINYFDAPPIVKIPSLKRLSKRPVCGKRHKKRLAIARGRILGGNSALPGTHPWMAAIYVGKLDFCAGTLVSSCWIISAAHCFFRKYDLFILFNVFIPQQAPVTVIATFCGSFPCADLRWGGRTSKEASCGDSDLPLWTGYIYPSVYFKGNQNRPDTEALVSLWC